MSRDSATETQNKDIPRNTEDGDNSGKVEVNPAIDPRQAHLNELAERRRKEREAENAEHIQEPEPEVIAAEDEGEPPANPPPEEKDYFERDGKLYLKTKVDGEEEEVELTRLKADYQKYRAGDKRLARAAAEEKRLKDYEQQLFLREQAMKRPKQESKPPEKSGASDDVEAEVGEALDAIYSGDDEKARKALAKLVAGRQQPTQRGITPDEVDQRVRQATQAAIAQQEQQRAVRDAVTKFRSEYDDIASDPELFGMADRLTLEVAQEQPDLEPYQIMQEAGDRVRAWLKKYKANDSGMSDRTQRKRQAMGTVPGANRTASLGKDEPPPKTRHDVVHEMKRQRGQMI